MAKMFYSTQEACQKLGKNEEQIKGLVREGKLREFRDAGSINYRVSDVDGLLKAPGGGVAATSGSAPAKPTGAAAGGSASGEIVLEPADDSSIELAPASSDIMTLEGDDSADTTSGGRAVKKANEGSAVPSVGINVFDDDELDEHVDPLAQTAVSDVAGLGIEGAGSGSGILDLTRESDDTSLGAELLDEIYSPDEGKSKEGSSVVAGSGSAVGMEEAEPEVEGAVDEVELAAPAATATAIAATKGTKSAVVTRVVVYEPDAESKALTALIVAAVVIMGFGGLAAASLVQGTVPGLLQAVYSKLGMYSAVAVVGSGIAAGATYFVAKRSG
ncbi:MAG: helix-turn-helix domain-containing protein [Planctomycetota bacterium]